MSKTSITLEHLEHQECPVCSCCVTSVDVWPEIVRFTCGCVIAWDGGVFGDSERVVTPCPNAHEKYLRLKSQQAKAAGARP